jgi:N-acetylglutamate synthase-like GNAT family acetyltransferase
VLPTLAIQLGQRLQAFVNLREHFAKAWEVHCMAVRADAQREGHGSASMTHAEDSLAKSGIDVLQVKTSAQKKPPSVYGETRSPYAAMGFTPSEVFP